MEFAFRGECWEGDGLEEFRAQGSRFGVPLHQIFLGFFHSMVARFDVCRGEARGFAYKLGDLSPFPLAPTASG